MHDRIHDAFDAVRAEDSLKRSARACIAAARRRSRRTAVKPFAVVAFCLFFTLFGGTWFYLTPVANISIDGNASIELSLNALDRVIAVRGFGAESVALADTLELFNSPYEDAVADVLTQSAFLQDTDGAEAVSVCVASAGDARCARLMLGVQRRAAGCFNITCCSARAQEMKDAESYGLSCGKYRAWLELSAMGSALTAEDVREMSMREIRGYIDGLSENETKGRHGAGNGFGGAGNDRERPKESRRTAP